MFDPITLIDLMRDYGIRPHFDTAIANLAKAVKQMDPLSEVEVFHCCCTDVEYGDPKKAVEAFGADYLLNLAKQLLDYAIMPSGYADPKMNNEFIRLVRTLHSYTDLRFEIDAGKFAVLAEEPSYHGERAGTFIWLLCAYGNRADLITSLPPDMIARVTVNCMNDMRILGPRDSNPQADLVNFVELGLVLEPYQEHLRAYNAAIDGYADKAFGPEDRDDRLEVTKLVRRSMTRVRRDLEETEIGPHNRNRLFYGRPAIGKLES